MGWAGLALGRHGDRDTGSPRSVSKVQQPHPAPGTQMPLVQTPAVRGQGLPQYPASGAANRGALGRQQLSLGVPGLRAGWQMRPKRSDEVRPLWKARAAPGPSLCLGA